jgi:hypothetical protein
MSTLKYYISTEYPVELSNELKDHVSIYSKRKSNNKLIILKELVSTKPASNSFVN